MNNNVQKIEKNRYTWILRNPSVHFRHVPHWQDISFTQAYPAAHLKENTEKETWYTWEPFCLKAKAVSNFGKFIFIPYA